MSYFIPAILLSLSIGFSAYSQESSLSKAPSDSTGQGLWSQLTNSGVWQSDHPENYQRILAISDVHGMSENAILLLREMKIINSEQKWIAGSSLLIVIGDSIDKGPDSIDVLDLWISLQKQARVAGGDLIHTLGNHEAEFLANPLHDAKSSALYDDLKRKKIEVNELFDIRGERGQFLAQMPLAARVGRWLFSHAGLYPDLKWSDFVNQASKCLQSRDYSDPLLADDNSILEAKDWWKKSAKRRELERRLDSNQLIGIVQGHQPKAYDVEGEIASIEGGRFIKIDTGMAPQAGGHSGQVLIFPKPEQMNLLQIPETHTFSGSKSEQILEPSEFRD
jgi:hypothetical protein